MSVTYDVEDRMTGAGPQSLTYRPDGLRAIQNDGGGIRTYLYDGAAPVEELDGSGNIVADHEYGPTGYLGNNDRGPFNTFTTDPTGNGIQSYSIAAGFSPVAYPMGAYGTLGGTNVPSLYYKLQNDYYYGWNGYTGLIGMGARNYDAQTGRFLTRDPLGYGGGMNLYAFVDGDPINESDPSGLFPDGNPLGEMFQSWDNAGAQFAGKVGAVGAAGFQIAWNGLSKFASIFRAPQGGDMLDPPNQYTSCPDPSEGSGGGAPTRVRYWTSQENVPLIKSSNKIYASRGFSRGDVGVHFEVGPTFGPAHSAFAETGAAAKYKGEVAGFVEFDAPNNWIPTNVGPRSTGYTQTSLDGLNLTGLNPLFSAAKPWWKLW